MLRHEAKCDWSEQIFMRKSCERLTGFEVLGHEWLALAPKGCHFVHASPTSSLSFSNFCLLYSTDILNIILLKHNPLSLNIMWIFVVQLTFVWWAFFLNEVGFSWLKAFCLPWAFAACPEAWCMLLGVLKKSFRCKYHRIHEELQLLLRKANPGVPQHAILQGWGSAPNKDDKN